MMQQRAGLSPRTILVGLGALAFVLYVLLSSSAPAVPPAHHPHVPVGPPPSTGLESQQNGQPTSKKQDYLSQELLKRLSDVVQRVSALEEQYQQKMMNNQIDDDDDNSDKEAGEKSEATPAQLQRELEELRKVVAQLAKETKVWASAEEAKRNETNRLKLELAELREAVARKAEERAGDKAVPPTAQEDAKAGAEPTREAPAKQEEPAAAPAATGEAKKGLPTVSPAGKPSPGRQQQQQAPAQAKKEEKAEKVAAIVDDEVDEVDEDAMDDGEGPKIPPECVDLWMAEGDKAAFVRALAGQKAKNYLEWSDGSSTLCAARLAANVTAIVYDQDCKGLRERLNASRVTNVNLICPPVAHSDRQTAEQEGSYTQFRDYVDVVDKVGVPHYDAVFIDGRARVACAQKTLNYISGNSLVMLYDWQPLRTEVKRWYEDVPAYRLDSLGVLRKKDVYV